MKTLVHVFFVLILTLRMVGVSTAPCHQERLREEIPRICGVQKTEHESQAMKPDANQKTQNPSKPPLNVGPSAGEVEVRDICQKKEKLSIGTTEQIRQSPQNAPRRTLANVTNWAVPIKEVTGHTHAIPKEGIQNCHNFPFDLNCPECEKVIREIARQIENSKTKCDRFKEALRKMSKNMKCACSPNNWIANLLGVPAPNFLNKKK